MVKGMVVTVKRRKKTLHGDHSWPETIIIFGEKPNSRSRIPRGEEGCDGVR